MHFDQYYLHHENGRYHTVLHITPTNKLNDEKLYWCPPNKSTCLLFLYIIRDSVLALYQLRTLGSSHNLQLMLHLSIAFQSRQYCCHQLGESISRLQYYCQITGQRLLYQISPVHVHYPSISASSQRLQPSLEQKKCNYVRDTFKANIPDSRVPLSTQGARETRDNTFGSLALPEDN